MDLDGRYGLFMHYQYRMLLGYKTPELPKLSELSPAEFNAFVDGFDVHGFARQMAEGGVSYAA